MESNDYGDRRINRRFEGDRRVAKQDRRRTFPGQGRSGRTATQNQETTTPTPNNTLAHRAAGNLGFLLSVIRCGEPLSQSEEANVRGIIDELEGRKAKRETQIH